MFRHVTGGGQNETIDAAACQWVREHESQWRQWISHTALDDEAVENHLQLTVVLSVVCVLIVAAVCTPIFELARCCNTRPTDGAGPAGVPHLHKLPSRIRS